MKPALRRLAARGDEKGRGDDRHFDGLGRAEVLQHNVDWNAEVERVYHLDEPVWRQYLFYLGNLLRGDLGPSYVLLNFSVAELFADFNNIVKKDTLVACTDPHFRPSHIILDPDGNLLSIVQLP